MQHPYQAHGGGAMYTQPRPDWAGYATHPQHGMPGYAVTGAQTPTSAAPAGARPGQVGYPVATHPAHLHQVNSARPHCELQIVVPRRVRLFFRPLDILRIQRRLESSRSEKSLSTPQRTPPRVLSLHFEDLLTSNSPTLYRNRCTPLSPSPAPSNTSDPDDGMRRLSGCTSVGGTGARRRMAH
jgi:hypothetical protein